MPHMALSDCSSRHVSFVSLSPYAHAHTEAEPSGLTPGIEVMDLRKKYGKSSCFSGCFGKKKKPFMAVDGVTFTAYEGQITSFLGHNGAGVCGCARAWLASSCW